MFLTSCKLAVPSKGEFFSIGIQSSDSLIASGCSGHIFVWDIRTRKLFRAFRDFHTEDITTVRLSIAYFDLLCSLTSRKVRFRPSENSTQVFSSSVDGNICCFDVQPEDEDDALLSGINIEDSINRIDFFGDNYDCVACLTTTEKLTLWNIDVLCNH